MSRKYRWRVDTWEYEMGWGKRPMGTEFFDDEESAKQYVKNYNFVNTALIVPEEYYMAETPVKVLVDS
jgi:hypothetical protein